jgi:hypothetical protein
MIKVLVGVYGIILHSIDVAYVLKLKIVQVRLIEIYPNNGAGIQRNVVRLVALPPRVGDQQGKANESRSPFFGNEDATRIQYGASQWLGD